MSFLVNAPQLERDSCPRRPVIQAAEAIAAEPGWMASFLASIPEDDDERAVITDPLTAEWFGLAEALEELDGPRTPEGARAMALAAMAEIPRNSDGTIDCGDLHVSLAMGCVEFILATVPG
jgi:hypothetical protein